MAKYIEGYCDQQIPPPYAFSGVKIWSFPLLASLSAVQDVITKYLGWTVGLPQKAEFSLIRSVKDTLADNSLLYLTVLDYGQMRPGSPPSSEWGYLAQREFYLGIPILREIGDRMDIVLFIPYIFVDNPWSMTCGNTVLGYPKQFAWFRIAGSLQNPYPIGIDTSVFVNYSPTTPQTWQLLAQIQSSGLLATTSGETKKAWPYGDVERLFGTDGVFPVGPRIYDLFMGTLGAEKYYAIQLKQFRNAQNITEASYQALVSFTVQLDSGSTWGYLPGASVALPAYDSLNLAADLGLVGAGATYMPFFPFWMSCDFHCTDVREFPRP